MYCAFVRLSLHAALPVSGYTLKVCNAAWLLLFAVATHEKIKVAFHCTNMRLSAANLLHAPLVSQH